MTPNFITRVACAHHADELTAIAHAAKRHWGYPEEYIALWRDGLTIKPEYIIANTVIIAQNGARKLGFYALREQGNGWLLDALFVDPPYIGQGVGAVLFRHACGRARRAGGRSLVLAADPNAEGFYRKQGATQVGRTPSAPAGRTLPLMAVKLR